MTVDHCFECQRPAEYRHHVVPRSMGGEKTVPLCGPCHGKVHDKKFMSISSLTRKAMQHMKEQGQYTGGKVPYGFHLVDGELVEHEGEQKNIRIIRKYRESGMTLRKIAEVLAEQGRKSRTNQVFNPASIMRVVESRAGKPFHHTAIARILRDDL